MKNNWPPRTKWQAICYTILALRKYGMDERGIDIIIRLIYNYMDKLSPEEAHEKVSEIYAEKQD